MPDRDRPLLFWKVRHISLDLGIEIYLAFFNQLKNGNCRHGLCDGSQSIRRLAGSWDFVLQISVSEPLDPHVAVFDKTDSQARNVFKLHLLSNEFLVDAKLARQLAGGPKAASWSVNSSIRSR